MIMILEYLCLIKDGWICNIMLMLFNAVLFNWLQTLKHSFTVFIMLSQWCWKKQGCKGGKEQGGKGAKGKGAKGKGARGAAAQIHIFMWWHPYLFPHVFSQFEEMHIYIAITVQETKCFVWKLVPLQAFIYLVLFALCSQVPFKEVCPPAPCNVSSIALHITWVL